MNETPRIATDLADMATRLLISSIALSIAGTLLFFGLLYLTIRYAIRDGLMDAQQRDRRPAVPRSSDNIPGPHIRTD